MQFYTSINLNYLPKARILAKSIKKHCPTSKFTLVLSDVLPETISEADEPFDEIITILELGLPVDNINLWIYEHSVVELCTAVKGQALVKFLTEGSEKVVYLDPDVAVFNDLECLNELMDKHDIILTPHVTIPETSDTGIWDNEICALKHGTFNFGFYAVKNSVNGLAFANWWRDRLINYCIDNIPEGLFTDQRWGDLAPCMFESVYIWKDPGCNVATWNISNRKITKDINNDIYVNNSILKFYHFSGFDSGSQAAMLDRYADGNKALYELRMWYVERQREEEQSLYQDYNSKYNFYDNGVKIEREERELLRNRQDVIEFFKNTNPFITDQERSYYSWYRDKNNHFKTVEQLLEEKTEAFKTVEQLLKQKDEALKAEENKLKRIYNSRLGWLIKKVVG